MSKRTPLYEEHKKLGAKIVDFAGWEMPIQYSGVTDEHLAVRASVGIFDVSHMGLFEISGEDTLEFLDYLTPSDNSKLKDMQAQYSLLLTDEGTVVDDIIVYRSTATKFYLVVNASNLQKDFEWIKSHLRGDAKLSNWSDRYSIIALQGPRAEAVLAKVAGTPLKEVKTFHVAISNIDGVGETILARTGYTGEDGFEIFVRNEKAPEMWRRLLEIGKEYGIKPIGLGARDTLRLEMKYSLYGHELTDETNALEAGLRWVIKFKKPGDFIGKDALLKVKEAGPTRRLVGFKMLDRAIPRHGYSIILDGKKVGFVTSGTFSPSLKIPIGVGYVDAALSEIGTKFSIDIRGRGRLAEVVKTPFYTRS